MIALLALLACTSFTGCTVCQNAKRTLCGEPSEFWWMADRKRSVKVYRSWADNAWCKHGASECGQGVSEAYEAGFKDGFVDFVFAGGSGEPPPVAPRKYWNVGNRKAHGHAEAAEWFAGFRHGAQVAHNEGYREQTIVPASVFFGPEGDCWEDQPCCVQPNLAAPLPEYRDPELLPPGQVETPLNADALTPTMPSVEIAPAEDLPEPIAESDSQQEFPIPATDESAPPAVDPSPLPQPPGEPQLGPLPESERDIENLFDSRTPDVTTTPPTHRSVSEYPTQSNSATGQRGQEAFAKAIRRSRRSASVSLDTTPTGRQVRQARHVEPPSRHSEGHSPSHSNGIQPVESWVVHAPGSSATTTARSDDRAEMMFRRLSKD